MISCLDRKLFKIKCKKTAVYTNANGEIDAVKTAKIKVKISSSTLTFWFLR